MAKKIPGRMCISCRQMKPKNELLRIVAADAGLVFDPTGRQPGRGAYVCKDSDCIKAAGEHNRLAKNLQRRFTAGELEDLLSCLTKAVADNDPV